MKKRIKKSDNCDYIFEQLKNLIDEKNTLISRIIEIEHDIERVENIKNELVCDVFEDETNEGKIYNKSLAKKVQKELE